MQTDLGLRRKHAYDIVAALPPDCQEKIFLSLSAAAHFKCTAVCAAWRDAAILALLARPAAKDALGRSLSLFEPTIDVPGIPGDCPYKVAIQLTGFASNIARECHRLELVEKLMSRLDIGRNDVDFAFRDRDVAQLRAIVSAVREDIERSPLTDADLVGGCCTTTHEAFSRCDHVWVLRGNPEDWHDYDDPTPPPLEDGLTPYQGGGMICKSCDVLGCMMECGRLNIYRRAIALLIHHQGCVCGRTGHDPIW